MGDVFLVKFVKLAPISNHLADLTMDESPWTPGLSLCWVGIITLTPGSVVASCRHPLLGWWAGQWGMEFLYLTEARVGLNPTSPGAPGWDIWNTSALTAGE